MSTQEFQKMFCQIDTLQSDMEILKQRIQRAPCIALSGLRNFDLYKTARQCDKEITTTTLIHMLFKLLKIPTDYILQIRTSRVNKKSKHTIPFQTFVYLTDDSIKLFVYLRLLQHIRKTKQTSVHVKIINYYHKNINS